MNTQEIISSLATIKSNAEKAKNDAKSAAPVGLKLVDGNFAKRQAMTLEVSALLKSMLADGYVPIAVAGRKEAKTRPDSCPVAVTFEKVTVTLQELRDREPARKAALKAARDANKVKADSVKAEKAAAKAAKVVAPAPTVAAPTASTVVTPLFGKLSAAVAAKKAA